MTYHNNHQNRPTNHWRNAGRAIQRMRHRSPGLLAVAFGIFALLTFCLFWALSKGAMPFTKTFGGAGLVVYILCQIGQLLWILIGLDRYANQAALNQVEDIQSQQRVQSQQRGHQPDEFVSIMREKVSKIPFAFVALSGWIALGCYVCESIVNWSAFPIIKNWAKFRAGLLLYKVVGLDWLAIGRYVFSLLSVEALVVALICVWFWIQAHRQGKKEENL